MVDWKCPLCVWATFFFLQAKDPLQRETISFSYLLPILSGDIYDEIVVSCFLIYWVFLFLFTPMSGRWEGFPRDQNEYMQFFFQWYHYAGRSFFFEPENPPIR